MYFQWTISDEKIKESSFYKVSCILCSMMLLQPICFVCLIFCYICFVSLLSFFYFWLNWYCFDDPECMMGTSEKINWKPGQLEWGGEGWGCLLLGPWEELLRWLDSSVDPSPTLINISPSLSPPPGSISVKTIRVNRNSRFSPTHGRHWVAIAGK